MSLDAPGSRVSMMIRLIGLVFLGLGVTLTYFTYLGAGDASIVPQIVPVFYLGSVLLMLVGFVAVIANYK
jgi:cation transporter-like permease